MRQRIAFDDVPERTVVFPKRFEMMKVEGRGVPVEQVREQVLVVQHFMHPGSDQGRQARIHGVALVIRDRT